MGEASSAGPGEGEAASTPGPRCPGDTETRPWARRPSIGDGSIRSPGEPRASGGDLGSIGAPQPSLLVLRGVSGKRDGSSGEFITG